jgi:hypothetical protein
VATGVQQTGDHKDTTLSGLLQTQQMSGLEILCRYLTIWHRPRAPEVFDPSPQASSKQKQSAEKQDRTIDDMETSKNLAVLVGL